jgi:hypothetical protein
MKMKKNIYTHEIELSNLHIKNRPREEFRILLEKVKYRGYEVDQLSDRRKIVITKPGGKFTYGKIRREDFMVWVYNPNDSTLWLITHDDIKDDLKEKGDVEPKEAIKIIDALERVYNGEEPDEVLKTTRLNNLTGESTEVLLKAYKWIWGQEDCNYPYGKGRAMSWEGWKKERGQWIKTGDGIIDLRERLKKIMEDN